MYILIVPTFFQKHKDISSIHGHFPNIHLTHKSLHFQRIAVSVDFSASDNKALNYALHLSNENSEIILIHILNNIGSIIYQNQMESAEFIEDKKYIERYCELLQQKNRQCSYVIGFGNPKSEIPRIVKEKQADVLIMAAHGHQTLKDFLLGTTIDEVRHKLDVPLLIV